MRTKELEKQAIIAIFVGMWVEAVEPVEVSRSTLKATSET